MTTDKSACLLCGKPPAFLGFFFPHAPRGLPRMIGYALCRRCGKRKDSPRRVEERILADLARSQREATAAATNN
jgi:hypothetical protein